MRAYIIATPEMNQTANNTAKAIPSQRWVYTRTATTRDFTHATLTNSRARCSPLDPPLEPWLLSGAALLLMVSALTASAIPARADARIDPGRVLRIDP